MKRSTRLLALGMAGFMGLTLAACGSSDTPAASTTAAAAADSGSSDSGSSDSGSGDAAAASAEGVQMTLIMAQRDEFLSTLESGCTDAASALGVNLTVQDANQDSGKMLQFVGTAKAAGHKAVIVNMVDPTTAQSVIDEAGDMKVVFVNRVPDDPSVLTDSAVYVGSNENESGKYQGEFLAEYFKDKGQTDISYILLNGILGQTSTTLRTASVLKALEDNGINATEATAPLAGKYDRAEAMNKISPLLTSGLQFDCIISNNDSMALGAIEALENNNMDPSGIPIVGIDATADGCQAIKDGKLSMSVFQNGPGQGSAAIHAAINLINGSALNADTDFEIDTDNEHILWVPFEPVTAENVDDYD